MGRANPKLVSGGCLPVSISGDKIPVLVISCLHYCRSLLSGVFQFSSVQSLSHVRLFATPWTAARQASLSFTISQNLLGLIDSVMPSNHLISVVPFPFCLQSFPASRYCLMSWLFTSGSQNIGASASASVVPMNIQDCFPLGLTSLIALLSKGLSRVFSNTSSKASILWHSASFIFQLSHPYMTTGKTIALTRWPAVNNPIYCCLNRLIKYKYLLYQNEIVLGCED